jgi:DNA-binding Xre family transcriptional regulator
MENETLPTYDQLMKDPKRRRKFEEEYQQLVLVEILIPILEKSQIPVRALAKIAGVSPTIIQDIKSGKKEGISYPTFLSILEALGYRAKIQITKSHRSNVRSRTQLTKQRQRVRKSRKQRIFH